MSEKKGLFGLWLAALFVCVGIGLFAAFKLFSEGHYLFNTNDVIIWSLPLGVYIFLALTSSGLTLLSAIPLVFGIERYLPFAKRLVFLAIATLCGAFVSIGLELGNVWHMMYILLSPNLSSPIWWMGAIYSIELVFLILKFYKMHRGDWSGGASKALGVASFICALVAPLMIGSVFGITESRVTYFGPVMSIYCLGMALLSGTALFILYSMVLKQLALTNSDEQNEPLYREFMTLFTYTAAIVVIFTIVKYLIEATTVVPEFLAIRNFAQPFGTIFGIHTEIVLGLFIPFILLLFPGIRNQTQGRLITSAIAWVGTLGMHMQILIAGQSHPIGPKAEQYGLALTYHPSLYEWIVFLFAVAVMLLLYTAGERYLKLEAVPD